MEPARHPSLFPILAALLAFGGLLLGLLTWGGEVAPQAIDAALPADEADEVIAQRSVSPGGEVQRVGEPGADEDPSTAEVPWGTVLLQIEDVRSKLPIRDFSWSQQFPDARRLRIEEVQRGDSVVELRVPRDRIVRVLVSAPGYVSSLPIDISLRNGLRERRVPVRLLAGASEGPQLRFELRDPMQQPVECVRITCLAPIEGEPNGWQALWTRQSTSQGSNRAMHEIAGLETGRYRFRLQALKKIDGRPRLLLPRIHATSLESGRTATAALQFETGGSIVVRIADMQRPAGLPGIILRDAQGTALARRWIAVERMTAANEPRTGALELDEPVPPGEYVLSLRDAEQSSERALTVLAGRRTEVTLH